MPKINLGKVKGDTGDTGPQDPKVDTGYYLVTKHGWTIDMLPEGIQEAVQEKLS